MVAPEVPVLVTVIVWLEVLPATTLPKATLPGFKVRVAFEATPLPAREIVCGEFGAASVKIIEPVAPPATVGAN